MKIHLPIVGKATGSSAGLIYQSYWGNTYTRSFPFSFHYPDTSKQQKCQFDFFRIQRAWWPIYNKLKFSIPKQCRRNTNVYNKLSKGLYEVFMTYSIIKADNIVEVWGLDERKAVIMYIEKKRLEFEDNVITARFSINGIYGKRHFSPQNYNMLLCNITQQEFYFQTAEVHAGLNEVKFLVLSEWSRTDIIVAYVAFSNEEFFTNFYLSSQ